jgi:acyl carrier protein
MDIQDKIRQFIVKNLYFTGDNDIGAEDSFLETGVVDSMGVMELVGFIQSEFGIEVEQHEITVENFDSIRRLADFVAGKLPGGKRPVGKPGGEGLPGAVAMAGR